VREGEREGGVFSTADVQAKDLSRYFFFFFITLNKEVEEANLTSNARASPGQGLRLHMRAAVERTSSLLLSSLELSDTKVYEP